MIDRSKVWSGTLNDVADMINGLELARGQLAALKAVTEDSLVRTRADSLDQALLAVEEDLVQLRITGRGQDLGLVFKRCGNVVHGWLRSPKTRLVGNICFYFTKNQSGSGPGRDPVKLKGLKEFLL